MSEENVKLAYRAVDAFNRRDIDAFIALCDEDVEAVSRLVELEGGGSYRGHDGIRSWWESLLGAYPDFSVEIDEIRDLGGVTVTGMRLRAHGKESDAPVMQQQWQVTEWRQGRATWWQNFLNETEALEAAGARE
jgi:ketosteroid isomerase-like protein